MSLSTHEELLLLRKRARRRLVGAVFLVLLATGVLWNVLGHLPEQEMRPESVEISGLRPASAPAAVAQASQPAAQASQGVASAPETDILASLPPEDSVLPPPEATASKPVAKPAKLPAAPVVAPPPVAVAPHAAVVPPAAVVARAVPEPAHAAKVIEAKPQAVPAKPSEKPQPVEKKAEKKVEKKAEKKVEEVPVKKAVPDPAAILEGRDDAPPAAKKADKTDKAADKTGKFQVQMAALSDPDKISSLKQRLSSAGISAHFSKVQTSKGEVTRVRIGPFGNRADADAALRKLERAGVSGIIVTQ